MNSKSDKKVTAAPVMQVWVELRVDSSGYQRTHVLEVPGVGCFLRNTALNGEDANAIKRSASVCFAAGVRYDADSQRLVPIESLPTAATTISMSTWSNPSINALWQGDAGTKLDSHMQQVELKGKLNKFIRATWKITPTLKQLHALVDCITKH